RPVRGGDSSVREGLSTAEVGKEIGEHSHHAGTHQSAGRHGRVISITEAVLLSIVAIIAAWSGYSAAKWGTESSLKLAKASATRTKANRAHPFTNPNAPPGPQAMPQYHAAGAAQSKLLDSQADTYYADG